MSRIRGSTILITGGASGLGRLLGLRMLEAGAAQLLIWDRQVDAMAVSARGLQEQGYKVVTRNVDLADPAAIGEAAEALESAGLRVDILVNNAGIVCGRSFVEHEPADIAATMAVNSLAPMYLSRSLLPGMLARRCGHIVNIASAAGMVSNPKMSVYCASKWAMIGWSDSLRIEMEREQAGIKVTTVAPFYIDTGMFDGVQSRFIPVLQPELVVRRIMEAVRSDRIFLRLPRILCWLPLLQGLLPIRWFDRIAGEWLGIYHSMDAFRGRTQR